MARRGVVWNRVLFPAVLLLAIALAVAWVVGARPASPVQGATLTVTSTTDGGAGSLREVIAAASPGDTIQIPAGTYTLTLLFQLTINKDLTLAGSGAATTIIQAATGVGVADFRVFNILTGNRVAISGLTIRHGGTSGSGAGLFNSGTLTLSSSTVSGNKGFGAGAIFFHAVGSTLTVINSTISNNTNIGGTGGILNHGGTVILVNTIIANSPSGRDCGGPVSVTPLVTSLGHNLDSDGTCGLTATGDLPNTNPLLSPLQDNGGPTFTHALLPGSPAIDAGDNSRCPDTDQRRFGRPVDGNSDGVAICDIGAYEFGAALAGDVNRDGRVDFTDLRRVAAALGPGRPADPDADVNSDRLVDILDVARVGRNFGQGR